MLQVNNLSVRYGARVLFDAISFQVSEQERIGLAGRNGAGKSTLLKILAGLQKDYEGSVQYPKEYRIGYLKQELDYASSKTVIEEASSARGDAKALKKRMDELSDAIGGHRDYQSDHYAELLEELGEVSHRYELLGADKADKEIERVLLGLGFEREHLHRPVNTFSGGWQMRVELAKILLEQPDLLLLDEPTNHLDIESIIWLEGFLRNYPGSLILVSHDKRLLDNLTRRTIEIELGKMYDYKANYSQYVEQRKLRREKMMREKKNQDRFVEHTEQLINKFRAKKNKAAFAQSLIKKLERIERIEIEDTDSTAMKLRFPEPPRSGQRALYCKQLSKRFGEHLVLDHIDLEVERGEKIAFVGRNGEGKTTLSKIIAGMEDHEGQCELGHNVQLGFFAQHQNEMLDGNSTVLECIEDAAPDELRPRVRAILGAYLFSSDDVYKKIKVLSGGEKARLSLAKLMLQPYNFLVMDEPTNHLDMVSKEILKQAILQYQGTVIIVSHDREFLSGLTGKVYEFRNKKIHEFMGDINYFLEKRKIGHLDELSAGQGSGKKEEASADKEGNPGKSAYEKKKAQERMLRKLKNGIRKREKEIEALQTEMASLEKIIYAPGFYETAVDPQLKFDEYSRLKKRLENAEEAWTQMQIDKEALESESGMDS